MWFLVCFISRKQLEVLMYIARLHSEERILCLLQLFLIFRGFFWAWVGFYF